MGSIPNMDQQKILFLVVPKTIGFVREKKINLRAIVK